MTKKKKCPKCGYDGSMNTYRQYKLVNSKLVLTAECYCPKCKVWIKLEG